MAYIILILVIASVIFFSLWVSNWHFFDGLGAAVVPAMIIIAMFTLYMPAEASG